MQKVTFLEGKYFAPLEEGIIELRGAFGKVYPTKALFVPGYGLIPCSIYLREHYTNDPKYLAICEWVSSEKKEKEDEQNNSPLIDIYDRPCVTSDIWITRRKVDPEQAALTISVSDLIK